MNFTTAVKTCLSKYATFSGRAPRSEFWWFYLFIILVDIVLGFFIGSETLVAITDGDFAAVSVALANNRAVMLQGVVHLLLFLPSLAVAVRRLHDVGRSGWWLLLLVVPFGFLFLLYWWLKRSEPRPNAHGMPPLPALLPGS